MQIIILLFVFSLLLFVFSLPVVILLDSKKRLGRPRWGWALISGFALMLTLGRQIGREIQEIQAFGNSGSLDMMLFTDLLGSFIGGFIGAWLFFFAIYRGFTRKKTPDKPKQGQQQ